MIPAKSIILSFLPLLPAGAQYLSHEPFAAYSVGAELQSAGNPVVGGYAGDWTDIDFGDSEPAVSDASLSYGDPDYAGSSGAKLGKQADQSGIGSGTSGRVYRLLDESLKVQNSTTGTRYLSWLFRTGNENAAADPAVYQTLALYQGSTADADRNFDAGVASNDFGTQNFAFRAENSSTLRGNLNVARDTNVHLFVAKFSLSAASNGDSVTVWIDPPLAGGEPAGGVTRGGFDTTFDRIAISDYASNSAEWDEIRWGDTFASVTVLPSEPYILRQPASFTGSVGSTVSLAADIIAKPAPAFQWQVLQEGGSWADIPGATTSTYTIPSAAYTANGSYRIVATNSNGTVISDPATVSLVYPAPVISAQPSPRGVEVGESVAFSVTATGLGSLSYQWSKDGAALTGETSASMAIPSVTAADAGVYSVKITDDAAAASALEPVSVISDPAILLLGDLADFEAGLTFRLYDIQEEMDLLYPLVPGQTPNVDQKRSSIDWDGPVDFANYSEEFVAEIIADLFVATPGLYAFRLTSSDGSILGIGEMTVAANDGIHGATQQQGSVELTAGLHPLNLRFFKNTGTPVLKLEWRVPGTADFVTVPPSAFLTTAGVTRVVAPGKKNVIRPGDGSRPGSGQPLAAVHPSWRVTTIHPSSFKPKVGAMAVHPDGRLFITTFEPNQNHTPDPLPGGDGKVWALANVEGENPEAVAVTEVAAGLSEPLGMCFIDGDLLVSQRTSLTKLRDTNGDGYYETKQDIGGGWDSSNYHHFHFGLVEKDGFAYSTLSTSIHFDYPGLNGPNPPNRGTWVRTNLATGEVSYLAGGLRTPNGICLGPENEIFQTDNQGAWQPASRLNHLRPGHFYGHYNSTADGGSPSLFAEQPATPPAVWFPQNEVANSPSQPVSIPEGPFAGDLLVGDITLGGINRVSLEKVQGTWQGCIYRFTQGLEGGVNRLAWGQNGTLFVGCIGASGNWSWKGTTTGVQRLTPKAGNPTTFEIAKVKATADGFEIFYTKPVPEATLESPANFTVRQWAYESTAAYGGAKIGEETLPVSSATASAGRTSVKLVIPGLKKGHVIYLKSDPLSDDGSAILSSEAWYTLNEIPNGATSLHLDSSGIDENLEAGAVVGHLTADPADENESFTYTLPNGIADNSWFTLDGNTLRTAVPFDYERRASYQVGVRAVDGAAAVTEQTFTITVNDAIDEHPPRRILLTNAVLPPDHEVGAIVGQMRIDDEDLGDLQLIRPTVGGSAPLLHEPFDYDSGAFLSGSSGGDGFSGPWEVLDNGASIGPGSLSYTDSLGLTLATSGNSATAEPTSRNHRTLSGSRGADGTVTYASFVADPGANLHFWALEFWNGSAADSNRVLQIGNENGFGARVRNGANKLFPSSDNNLHFFVVKVEHLIGDDRVSVWIDPRLQSEPAEASLTFSPTETGGSIAFSRIGFSDYVAASAPAIDEIRLGESWGAVTPYHAEFPRFEFAAGAGDDHNSSFLIQGDSLIAAAQMTPGLKTVRVRATDSAGLSFDQRLGIWIGNGSSDTNGDGLSDGDAVRLGQDPLQYSSTEAYFSPQGIRPKLIFGESGFQLDAPAIPGNLYWIESSADLSDWEIEPGSITSSDSFLATGNLWELGQPGDERFFWRVGGGWPLGRGSNPIADGLAGLTFVGGDAGWSYDPETGVLRHDSAAPSEWVHFGSELSDFFLSLEYRLSPGGNAGVFLRADGAGEPWITGSEIQITNEARLPIHSTGSVYDRVAALPLADARPSIWHRMEILMLANRLRVAVDGIVTVDEADLASAYPQFTWADEGFVGLQNSHAGIPGSVEYRNIKLLKLDSISSADLSTAP